MKLNVVYLYGNMEISKITKVKMITFFKNGKIRNFKSKLKINFRLKK